MAGNGDSSGYGGDEEPTPAEPSSGARISVEARTLVNIGLQFSHASECMWRAARLYDASEGDDRAAMLSRLIAELSAIVDATNKARTALVIKRGEATTK